MKDKNSFTLIDVLVGTTLVLIVFLGIFGAYQLGIKVVGLSQNKITATSLANQWLEKIRNLPYESVGTKSAILPYAEGILDNSTTTLLNNIEYNTEIKVKYISDSADGLSPLDNCDLDYKRAQIKVSWAGRFRGDLTLVTDVAPKDKVQEVSSCEEQPAGILSVSVFDAYGLMVQMPLIEIFNPETGNLIDSYSPSSGEYDFPLATSTYQVVVSKPGYSTDRTYGIDEVVTPEKYHPLVLKNQVTEISFSIDQTSHFSVDTKSPWGEGFFSDSFQDESKISQLSNIAVSWGEAELATNTEGYVPTGFLISAAILPQNLLYWGEFSFTDWEPAETDIKYQFYYASGTEWIMVPDSGLAGNAVGFSSSPVDLANLNHSLYSELKIKASFSTDTTSTSPILQDWQVSWITSEPTPIPEATFHLRGEKLIGWDSGENPVYKHSQDYTTNYQGHIDIPNLEWDIYNFSVAPATGLDLADINPSPQPVSLPPNSYTQSVTLYLDSQNSLLLTVQDIETLEPVFAASCVLSGQAYSQTQATNEKGQTYFIPLEEGLFSLNVAATGYLATSTQVSVFGDKTKILKLRQEE